MILRALNSESVKIAFLHKETISEGFLPKLGVGFLQSLYSFLVKKELVLIYREESNVLGFISCAISSRSIIKRFLLASPRGIIKLIIAFCRNPKLLKPILETMHTSMLSGPLDDVEIPETELLSISVSPFVQKGGIGTSLLLALEAELKKRNINKYKVVAGAKLEGANQFYKKNGFVLVKQICIHNSESSNVYVKAI